MENLRLLGGSAGTLLIENNGRFYPVCDASFKKSHKKRLADQVCRQLGLGQVLFVGNKEEKSQTEKYACENWESSCEKCFDAFLIVGGKCSRQKNDKQSSCEFKYAAKHGQGSCIKGRSELLIKCDLPAETKRQKHEAWSSWSDCDPNDNYFRHRSRECKHGSLCKGHWLEMKPGCRCTDEVQSDESYPDDYFSDSSDDAVSSEIVIPSDEKETETFDPTYVDYYSARAHRPDRVQNHKKYKEAFCADANLFKKRTTLSSCESANKKTTTMSPASMTTTTFKQLFSHESSPVIEDEPIIDVYLRQDPPITDVGHESLEEGGMLTWPMDTNVLLIGTVSIGFLILIIAAVLYVKCVINKEEDTQQRDAYIQRNK